MQTEINYSGLNDCSNEWKQIADSIKDISDEFMSCIDSLVDNGWSGMAALHFKKLSLSLQPIFDQSYTQMMSYITYIDNIVDQFKSIDSYIINSLGKKS